MLYYVIQHNFERRKWQAKKFNCVLGCFEQNFVQIVNVPDSMNKDWVKDVVSIVAYVGVKNLSVSIDFRVHSKKYQEKNG